MVEKFNALDGMSCQKADGAMYLFPSIEMPKKALEEAEKRGKPADVMYALDLLGEYLVCRFRVESLADRGVLNRCNGYLCCRRVWIRSRERYLPLESNGALPGCGGVRYQD